MLFICSLTGQVESVWGGKSTFNGYRRENASLVLSLMNVCVQFKLMWVTEEYTKMCLEHGAPCRVKQGCNELLSSSRKLLTRQSLQRKAGRGDNVSKRRREQGEDRMRKQAQFSVDARVSSYGINKPVA